MNLKFLGGAREIGASCILLNIDNKNLMLDCGIRQGGNKDILPDFRTVQECGGLDAIIISHAHMDHIGALPIISKEYPDIKIYMNNMTKDLVRVLLADSLKIMNSREGEIPLYAETDVENMLNRVFTINYQVNFEILDGIKLTFYPAGHIAGASCIYVTAKEGSFFYSGDFSIFPQKSIDGAKIPKLRPDTAVFESTYGDKLHSNRDLEEDRLINIVKKCINENGKMLIPAFALGRSQEVLLILKRAINNGKLKKVNIYVDGMIKEINRTYIFNPLYLKGVLGKKILRGIEPFYDDNIKAVLNNKERESILESKECSIIVSSSGMLTGGPSQSYAEKVASMENGYIVITGYQDEESPGRKLLDLLEAEKDDRVLDLNGKSIPVKCKVDRIGLSAHGDKGEIKSLINLLSPKNIFLVHGEETVIESLAGEISRETLSRVYAPKVAENIEIFINNPRKQIKKQLEFVLNKKTAVTKENLSELWKFVNENYGERLFTIEELLQIWKGNSELKDKEIHNLQKTIFSSIYFENDLRRFFMFKTRSKSEVEEALKPKALKLNEVLDYVSKYFKNYNYKKAGYKPEEKKVILNFDFPRALDSSINEVISNFESETCLQIEIKEQTNNNAAENLLRRLLKNAQIKKISFLINEYKVLVNIKGKSSSFTKEKEEFFKTAGLELIIKGEDDGEQSLNNNQIFESINSNAMEQNEAINYIDNCFKEQEFKPYKKSIKGKNYFELSFISPNIGKKYEEMLKIVAEDIGWNIGISNSVNQNEIVNLASRLCSENDIMLKKNPSFNPGSLKVVLKVENVDTKILEDIKKEFDYKTGCSLEW
ncbi:MAG: MBL fold metallo-hydrolase RNA specificity domain-containing protein [Bacillota bacterium]|nr:MBL fold metallo-hydrolase RNA specificity domain-containing protein [Bacillota bacterium]